MRYRTAVYDNKDGSASFAEAEHCDDRGKWRVVGRTNYYREYPRSVRARTAADALCKAHAKAASVNRFGVSFALDIQIEHV